MLKEQLKEIIANGENSGVEFKRDDIRPEELGREIVAFANFMGGMILLGVDDDGSMTGIQRKNCEEWVMNVFRDKVHPTILPYYEEVLLDDGQRVAVITLSQGGSKPYVLRHAGNEDIYIRIGSTSPKASRVQQARLFDSGGMLHTETMPVPRTGLFALDMVRIRNYLVDIIQDPQIPDSDALWEERLKGLGFLVDTPQGTVCSIVGLVLFGLFPRRYLPQYGLRIMAFADEDKSYKALLDVVLDGPLLGRFARDAAGGKHLIDEGMIEKLANAIYPFISHESDHIDIGIRKEKFWLYPWDAIRESCINAVVHRDWTRSVDIEISAYADRLEIIFLSQKGSWHSPNVTPWPGAPFQNLCGTSALSACLKTIQLNITF